MTHPPPKARSSRANGSTQDKEHQDDEDEVSLAMAPPPDGGWGWMVVFGSFMIHIIADGVTYSFGIFILEFTKYFESGKGATAWIASLLVGMTLCSGPISGSLVNKYGCRSVTIVGAILAGTCLAISVFATNIIFLYITIGFGTGFGFGLIYLPAIVSVTCYFERLRSLATGIAVCGSGLGTFLFAPLNEWLLTEFGWRGALLVTAGIVFNCTIFGALFRPLVPQKQKKVKPSPPEVEMRVIENKQALRRDLQLDVRHSVCNGADVPDTANGEWAVTNGLLAPPVKLNSTSAHDVSRPPPANNSAGPLTPGVAANGSSHAARFLRSETARMAMSHPAQLNHPPPQQQTKPPPRGPRPLSGLFARPDVFYRGSLTNIPLYSRSTPRLQIQHDDAEGGGGGRTMPDSAPPSRNASRAGGLSVEGGAMVATFVSEKDEGCCCGLVSAESLDTVQEMLDLSLLKDPIFILFTVSNFCTSIGFNIPYVYIVARAEFLGIPSVKASLLLSVIGAANTVGRIVLGCVSDKTWVNRLLVYNVCLTLCGLATMSSVLCLDFTSLVVYCSVYGFTIGAYVGLTSVILVDLLGLEALTNAFGLLLLFQGIASFLGPPIAGWLYDGLQSYDPGFLLAGVTIAASGLMLFFIPALQRYLARKNSRTATQQHH